MNLSYFVALRYLFSKKSNNVINIITWVSIIGIGVGSAAVILVLSVFNGLTDFIEGLFSSFDPDIKIVAARGKVFTYEEGLAEKLKAHPEVAILTRTVEGNVLLEYVDNQAFGTLKGVESNFISVNPIDTFVYEGEYTFAPRNGTTQAILGSMVADRLSANLDNQVQPISLSYIPQGASLTNPRNVNSDFLFPSGYFSIQKEFDEKYILTDFDFARELLGLKDEITAYELKLNDIDRAESIKSEIEEIVGADYEVLTWYEQQKTTYRVMKNEKYISYLILVLMMSIAAINIVGSLSMIVLEKTRDIAVLKSFGATSQLIRRVFLLNGVLVGGIGGGLGITVAFFFSLAQKYYGIIKLQGGESFRVKAFPIEMQLGDFLLVFFTVLILSIAASLYPSFRAANIEIAEGLNQ